MLSFSPFGAPPQAASDKTIIPAKITDNNFFIIKILLKI
jgi:hypothetical protein